MMFKTHIGVTEDSQRSLSPSDKGLLTLKMSNDAQKSFGIAGLVNRLETK